MNSKSLRKNNRKASRARRKFRAEIPANLEDLIDARFHLFKNSHPYFGVIDIEIEGSDSFVMYSNNDDLIAMTYFWYGANSYESRSVSQWVDFCRQSNSIFDIGAFTGLYSLVAASSNDESRVVAFEPARRTHARLLVNLQLNNLVDRVATVVSAVGDDCGKAQFFQFRNENVLGNGASLIDKGIPITSDEEVVDIITLDSYVDRVGGAPELIKIDVEQAEVATLKGMSETIANFHPVLIVEVVPSTEVEVTRMLKRHGYCIGVISELEKSISRYSPGEISKATNLFCEKS